MSQYAYWPFIAAGTGSVTSVGLSAPSIFTVTGSPVTSNGTLSLFLNTEPANTVFAGPASGADAVPTFRALTSDDFPITGSADHAAGFDDSGNLFSIPTWTFSSDPRFSYGFQLNNSVDTFPDAMSDNYYAINSFGTTISPSGSTTMQHPTVLEVSAYISQGGQPQDIQSVTVISSDNNYEGTGTIGNVTLINSNFSVLDGTISYMQGMNLGYDFGAAACGGSTVLSLNTTHEAGGTITGGVNGLSINGTINVDSPNGYTGMNITTAMSAVCGYTTAYLSSMDFKSGYTNPGGLNGFADFCRVESGASLSNLNGIILNPNLDAGSTISSFNSIVAAPASNGSIDNFTTLNASPSFASPLMNYNGASMNPTINGTVTNYSGVQVNPTLNGVLTNFTGLESNPTLNADCNNLVTAHLSPTFNAAVTSQYIGLEIAPGGSGLLTSATGIAVNLGSVNGGTQQKTGLQLNDCGLQVSSNYDTSVVSTSGEFQLNSLGGEFHIAAGSPLNGPFGFGNNVGLELVFDDDMGPDATGVNLGWSYCAAAGAVAGAAGKTFSTFNFFFAGAGIDPSSSGGTITDLSYYRALGLLPEGGTLAVTNMYAFKADAFMDVVGATNFWGVYVAASTADNFFQKSVSIGTTTQKSAPGVALEIGTGAGTFNLNGNNIVLGGGTVSYSPANPANWDGTPPSDVASALDRIAALLVTLNSGNPIP